MDIRRLRTFRGFSHWGNLKKSRRCARLNELALGRNRSSSIVGAQTS